MREVLRAALFPISPIREEECVGQAVVALLELPVADEDMGEFLRLELRAWSEAGSASPALRKVVAAALAPNNTTFGQQLSSTYFDRHFTLRSKHRLTHEQATVFLSHAMLILRLAYQERMSAAQIARLLSARDSRMAFYWRAVQSFLGSFRINDAAPLVPTVGEQQVRDLHALDKVLEEESFGDATPDEAADLVAEIASRSGVAEDVREWLGQLGGDGQDLFFPYLQILLFMCSIAEFYDHALSYAYEFSPRGQAALWLFRQFPESLLEAADNPILNNAKSVDRMDLGWAESKKGGQLAQARALANLLLAMEDLSYASKRELASWVRRWIHRILRSRSRDAKDRLVPTLKQDDDLRGMLNLLATASSGTSGIVEQRILDYLSSLMYRATDWHGRGVGDAVNASNLSRKKLGDVDFQSLAQRQVRAYEAHAGTLSAVYLEGHKRTLVKPLRLRMEDEWRHVSDPSQWTVEVEFIAHESAPEAFTAPNFVQDGVPIRFSTRTYTEFLDYAAGSIDLSIEAFNEIVVSRLNQPYTPQKARNVVMAAIEAVRSQRSEES